MKDVILPKLGLTMTRGAITVWHKSVGDPVAAGDALFTFETDKASSDVPSEWSGTLAEIMAQAGEEVDVFAVVARISDDEEEPSSKRRVNASPLARRLAAEHGINLGALAPADGSRIEKKDVEAAIATARSPAPEKPAGGTTVAPPTGTGKPDAPPPSGTVMPNVSSPSGTIKPGTPPPLVASKLDGVLPGGNAPEPAASAPWAVQGAAQANAALASALVVDVSMHAFDALCAQLAQAGDAGVRTRLLTRAAQAAWDGLTAPRIADLGGAGIELYLPGSAALPVLTVSKSRAALVFDESQTPAGAAAQMIVRFKGMLETPALFLAR